MIRINVKTYDKIWVKSFVNKKDLISKLKYFSKNDKLRKKIAKSGYLKYHKHMNNKIVCNYIMNCAEIINVKKPYWHNKF